MMGQPYTMKGNDKPDIDLSQQRLKSTDLDSIFDDRLPFIRNEIYARHGYKFSKPLYQKYFEDQEWYNPAENNKTIELNETEKFNAAFIKETEDKRAVRKKVIRNYLEKQKQRDQYAGDYLKKIDLDSIRYCGDRGYYKKIEYYDEGKIIERSYSISISKTKITVTSISVLGTPTKSITGEESLLLSPRGNSYEFYIDDKNRITESSIVIGLI